MVPVIHDNAHRGSVSDRLLQLRVGTSDVLQNHRDVIFVAATRTLHLHGGTDGHRRNGNVSEEEVFWATRHLINQQQGQIFGRDLLEEIEHHLSCEVLLDITMGEKNNIGLVDQRRQIMIVLASSGERVVDGSFLVLAELVQRQDVFLEMRKEAERYNANRSGARNLLHLSIHCMTRMNHRTQSYQ